MTDLVHIEVRGLDKLLAKMEKFPTQINGYLAQAGSESAERIILPTTGLKNYPPKHSGNAPPTPYYIRGRGMETAHGNDYSSENLKAQWVVKAKAGETRILNKVSYAHWVHGYNEQATAMQRFGWRKLFDVAKEKLSEIRTVYEGWVSKCIKDLGL